MATGFSSLTGLGLALDAAAANPVGFIWGCLRWVMRRVCLLSRRHRGHIVSVVD